MELREELTNYVLDTILKLSCSTTIDHRNYCLRDKRENSKLLEKFKTEKNINKIVDDIISEWIIENETTINNIQNSTFDDEEYDELEIKEVLFRKFINYVGLYEIDNLHSDYDVLFMDNFIKIIDKKN